MQCVTDEGIITSTIQPLDIKWYNKYSLKLFEIGMSNELISW